jgi:molybdenum cofactor guanylyltransferase/molybdopterin-guanine dinucleotide biosynthesis protein MobB
MRPLITGLVLAGGQGSRLGGRDKGLVEVGGRPLIAHVLARYAPQVDTVVINANRHPDVYARYGHPVVADLLGDFPGPLAGIASGLAHCRTPLLAVAPCDSPFLPADLVSRLVTGLQLHAAEIAIARSGGELQPVFALMHASLGPSLEAFLRGQRRKITAWYDQHRCAAVEFDDDRAFQNLNTPEDCALAEARLPTRPAPRLLGIAGFSGSGKTTLLTSLIPRLREAGLRLGVLKHAHHAFDVDYPGKDSYELRKAGAECVMVASAHRDAFIAERASPGDPALPDLLARFEDRALDLVLVEGFRHERFPKLEVHRGIALGAADRARADRGLLCMADDSIIAVASDSALTLPRPMPLLNVNDLDGIAAFVLQHYRSPQSAWPRAR